MREFATGVMAVLTLLACGRAYGLATQQIGPDSVIGHPTLAQPGWPKGIVEIPRHESRVYSIWVNGNENFYFKATPEEVNELIGSFSKARMRNHEVVIAAERRPVKTFRDDAVGYNVRLQIVAGIALSVAREGKANVDLPLEPRLTVYADDGALLEKVAWPKNLTINSEIPGLSIPSGRATPRRDVYYGRLEFADGSPPSAFIQGVSSRITLWEQREADGIEVGKVDYQGYFTVRLSTEEMADLRAGKMWLTATIGNPLTEARRTDRRIGVESLAREKDQAQPIQVSSPGYYYGRILFEDGSPPILDPAPWPGAEVFADFPYAGMAHLDSEGYFKVIFSAEQLEKLRAEKPRRNIYTPDPLRARTSTATMTFPVSLLSRDKAKAGAVKIHRPVTPKKDLPTAESRIGKPVPGFANVRFEAFQTDQAKDKPLLVCFWDAEQRSSRQCMQALEQNKEALQAKNLVVLAIHVGAPSREQVTRWLEDNDISLTWGAIEGDAHETLLAWGAKGAPWLVLTDERRIVTREGFNLDEFLTDK